MKLLCLCALTAGLAALLMLSTPALPQEPPTFNNYILRAVKKLAQERARGGYDINRAFTQDLEYDRGLIRASRPLSVDPGPNPTMCVAAVAEVIIEAINLYAQETGDASVYTSLPISSWTIANRLSMRANLFMYKDTDSRGTAHTLQRLGLGREKLFSELQPGDFVNLNRPRTGHAVVFLGYLTSSGSQERYDDSVVGFRYFSAQGKGRPDAGFGYRNGYFIDHCPNPRGRDDDCNIINSFYRASDGKFRQNQRLLNTGAMLHPSAPWRVKEALDDLKKVVTRGLEEEARTRGLSLEDLARVELERTLEEDRRVYEDGTAE